MIRISSGKFKGRRLLENKFAHIRPTTDEVRQALFIKLQFFVPEKKVLDLFCGTGAMGIEAFSRGASSVIFVDKDSRSVAMTKSNLQSLGIEQKVVRCNALSFLEHCDEKFDLIILDPPYQSGLYESVLSKIFEKQILEDDGIIVCEHDCKDKIVTSCFDVMDEKKYGNKALTYLVKRN